MVGRFTLWRSTKSTNKGFSFIKSRFIRKPLALGMFKSICAHGDHFKCGATELQEDWVRCSGSLSLAAIEMLPPDAFTQSSRHLLSSNYVPGMSCHGKMWLGNKWLRPRVLLLIRASLHVQCWYLPSKAQPWSGPRTTVRWAPDAPPPCGVWEGSCCHRGSTWRKGRGPARYAHPRPGLLSQDMLLLCLRHLTQLLRGTGAQSGPQPTSGAPQVGLAPAPAPSTPLEAVGVTLWEGTEAPVGTTWTLPLTAWVLL